MTTPGVADLVVFVVADQTPVPLVADFSGTPLTVCAGSTVQFTDLSTGGVTGWTWTTTGGTPATSTDQNPLIQYDTPGTYDVTLDITDGTQNETKTETAYITVVALPTATVSGGGTICTGAQATIDVALTGLEPGMSQSTMEPPPTR